MPTPTIWITVYCIYETAKEPTVSVPPPEPTKSKTVERASADVMIWLWHDRATAPGDVTDKEVALLWRKFQADPHTDDIGVRMLRRRVTMLWREYLTTN